MSLRFRGEIMWVLCGLFVSWRRQHMSCRAVMLCFVCVVVAVGCGSGGGGVNNEGDPLIENGLPDVATSTAEDVAIEDEADSTTYLFFSGSVGAVDPRTPAARIVFDQDRPDWARVIYKGRYDAVLGTSRNLIPYTLVYAKSGQLWKVSASLKDGLTPSRLSSEDQAFRICWSLVDIDPVRPADSTLVYELAGLDGDCETILDNAWRMVKIGMDQFATPLPAKRVMTSVSDPATGQMKSWLAKEEGQLVIYDALFKTKQILAPVSKFTTVAAHGAKNLLIGIDEGFYSFDVVTNRLSERLYQVNDIKEAVWLNRDDEKLWLVSAGRLSSILLNSNSPAEDLPLDKRLPTRILMLTVAEKNLVFIGADLDADSGETVYKIGSIEKASGAVNILLASPRIAEFPFISDEYIYYNSWDENGHYFANVMRHDGEKVSVVNNAWWMGASSNDVSRRGNIVHRVILGQALQGLQSPVIGNEFISYDAATFTRIAKLGFVMTGLNAISLELGYGRQFLVRGWSAVNNENRAPFQDDIYYLDVEQENSWTRVSSTPLINERPLR